MLGRTRRFALPAIAVLAALATGWSGEQAAAQDAFPNKTVRIILTQGVGGPTDLGARILASKLEDIWHQPVIVENRVGGSGIIGSGFVAKAAPDGYTLLLTTGSHAQNAATKKELPYDTVNDFAPVTTTQVTPIFFVVDARVPAKTLKEFVDLGKAAPGKYKFASYGSGTTAHMLISKLNADTGAGFVHVPYNNVPSAILSVLSGETQSAMTDLGTVKQYVAEGKIRILAVTGSGRSQFAPDIPTYTEAGLAGFSADGWGGLFAPGKTPQPVVDKIAADVAKALAMPDLQQKYRDLVTDAKSMSPADFKAMVIRDIAYWKDVVQKGGIVLE